METRANMALNTFQSNTLEIIVSLYCINLGISDFDWVGFSMWLKNEEMSDETMNIPAKSQIKHEMIISYNSTPFTIIMGEIEIK